MMFVVKNSDNPGTNIGRYFTRWEAQTEADSLNVESGTIDYYVENS